MTSSIAPRTSSAVGAPGLASREADPHRYYPDLDGLRALAVVPVVLFHAGATWLPGGFVGVDVFFVLSGFFITRQLIDDIDAGRYSIWRFYERRARRILPALFAMLLVTTIVGTLVLVPPDLVSFAKSLLATLAFVSNIHFWLESGYFAQASQLKPLLHTWSLAVEEQFYIFLPPVLWLVSRYWRRQVPMLLVVAALLSLGLCIWGAYYFVTPSFYLIPTRAWELLLGSIIAVSRPPALSRTLRDLLSITGLGLILASMLLIDEHVPFPGWAAMGPCVGAALVVLSSVAGGGIGNTVLTPPPIVFIGQISYSLYLWHWPPLAFFQYTMFRAPDLLEATGLVAVAFAFAVISWRYVEKPFRGSRSQFRVGSFAAFVAAAAIAHATAASALLWTVGLPQRMKQEALRYLEHQPFNVSADCFNRPPKDVREGRLCTLGAAGVEPSYFLWGDSHASRVAITLQSLGRRNSHGGWFGAAGACPPLDGVMWSRSSECVAFNNAVLEQIEINRPKIVVLSGMWAYYASGHILSNPLNIRVLKDTQSKEISPVENEIVFRRRLLATLERLKVLGISTLIVGPVPELEWSAPQRLAAAIQHDAPLPTGPTLQRFLQRQRVVLATLEEASRLEGVIVVYPHKVLCNTEVCDVVRNGKRLYFDDNHIDVEANRLLEPMIEEALTRLRQRTPDPALEKPLSPR